MSTIVSFFNHKGGVGKTTQLYNLAWALSLKGKKVLMVDADSQCNLSSQCLGEDGFENHYINFPDDNLKSGLAPAFEARPSLIKPVYCPKVQGNENLFLLPGSFDISQNETQLSVAINFNVTFLTMTNLPGSFFHLIQKCAEVNYVDYILIDLNPGLSAINQTLLFSSNYFVIPCGVDYFSKQAIKSLAKVLPNWCNWDIKAKEFFKDSVYPLPEYNSKFLGYTINNYNIKSQKPAKTVQKVVDEINSDIETVLVPNLKITENVVVQDSYRIAEIKNFNTLQQVSHRVNKPVFLLDSNDTGNSGYLKDNQELSIEALKETFDNFADFIIANT
ncbi:ParA family protein [Flavobacterium anhuiense]|uniref:ParA family protein n=1 Tax=Flavobacterium anhuiense TaxID=459526 RepID=UPI000E6D1F12|nr:ParA family protein [Flavobacterium anhuiense]